MVFKILATIWILAAASFAAISAADKVTDGKLPKWLYTVAGVSLVVSFVLFVSGLIAAAWIFI